MHRQRLLELIERYSRRWPEEEQVVARFNNFINGHERCFERDCWAGHITGSAWLVKGDDSAVLLTVQDDGVGINKGGTNHGDGVGLVIMQHRAGVLGAQLTVNGAESGGTVISCRLSQSKT